MAERVLVVGVGRSGRAIARLLNERGRDVRLTDSCAEWSTLPEDLRSLQWCGDEPSSADLADVDTLVLSPGVPLDAPLVQQGRRAGLRITGEVEEAFRISDVPVVAITGTNGKSTTTTLVSWLLEQQGFAAPAGGNLGTPYAELVSLHADAAVHVVEVSSFQAETLDSFRPRVGALLNLTPDHLSRHGTLEAYAQAKARVFARMGDGDTIVVGGGELHRLLPDVAARRAMFGVGPDPLGAWEEDGVLRVAIDGEARDVARVEDIPLAGAHHRLNVLAALAIAAPLGLDPDGVPDALRRFRGLAHRMEAAGSLRGMRCLDDSKATNVEAAVAGVAGLEAPVILVCGGKDDGQDFTPLAELEHVRLALGIGEAGARAAAAFESRGRSVGRLDEAVKAATEAARAGDLLVLSPAAKSFDQYQDFAERGRHFRRLVAEAGSVAASMRTHFIGVAGAGMSALAEAIARGGGKVSGSDLDDGPVLARLRGRGVSCHVGHEASHVDGARCVIVSSAIRDDNPELVAAVERGVEVLHRGDLLARIASERRAIAVTGSHGKTTTTGLLAHVLRAGGKDPLALVGGDLVGESTNVLYGRGDYVVCEADESDGSFARVKPEIAVVTNLDDEHLDHYGSFEGLARAVRDWIETLPPGARVCAGADDARLAAVLAGLDREVIGCGLGAGAEVRARDLHPHARGTRFRLDTSEGGVEVDLPLLGEHNVANATVAVGAALAAGLSLDAVVGGLEGFRGVARRFEVKGERQGVLVVDDYAHHPTEIAAVLSAVRRHTKRRVRVVLQPHRHTRTRALETAFASSLDQADDVIVTAVYGADEARPEDGGGHAIVDHLHRRGRVHARRVDDFDTIVQLIGDEARSGDVVLLLSAGNLGRLAPALLRRLQRGAEPGEAAEHVSS